MAIPRQPRRRQPVDVAAAVHDAAERLALLWSRAYDGVAHRVSPAQLRALTVMREHGPMNLTRLADELGAMMPAASRLCDRMVAAGLLRRAPSPATRREVLLSLTWEAEQLLDEIAEHRRRDIARVIEHMEPADRRALLRGLEQFARASDDHRPTSVAVDLEPPS